MNRRMAALALVALVLVPGLQAAPGPASGDCNEYAHQAVVAVASVINAGDNEVWSSQPGCGTARSATQSLTWVGRSSAPVTFAITTLSWTAEGFTGCTMSTPSVTVDTFTAASATSATATLTMQGPECHGTMHYRVLASATSGVVLYQYDAQFPVNVRVEQTYPTSFTNSLNGNLGVAITSWPTLTATVATSGTLTLSGTLGAQHLVIDQWPTLAATVANSGTVNVVNSGGEAFQLTCPTPGCPTLNVQNSGGTTVAVTSLPQLQVAITSLPTLNIQQATGTTWNLALPSGLHVVIDRGTLNAILNGTLTTNERATIVGNTTNILHFPDTLHLCGTMAANGTCQPIQSTTPDALARTGTILGSLAWLVWIVAAAASRFLRRALVRVVSDLAMFAVLALPMATSQWQLLFVANAALFLYDMMAVMAGD